MDWYIKVMKNYFIFTGRARRKEYWMFILMNTLLIFALVLMIALLKLNPLIVTIYQLATFIPSIAVGVRRAHDTNHNGWWIVIPFYNFYLFMLDGDQGINRFGPSPKGDNGSLVSPPTAGGI